MSAITLLDGSLQLSIFLDQFDLIYDDNICLCFREDCPEEEKFLKADETSIYLTPEQAALMLLELTRVLNEYRANLQAGATVKE